MREKLVLLSISIIASILIGTSFTTVFSEEDNTEEYVFDKSCNQDKEFRILYVNSTEIKVSSGFFNKTSITSNKIPGHVYKVIENGATVELNDNLKNPSDKIYCIHHLDSQNSTFKNSSYLIISDADPCGAYGAFRIVNVHWDPKEDEILWFEVFSLYFGKPNHNYPIVGNSTIRDEDIKGLEGDIHIHIDRINCNNTTFKHIDENFGYSITSNRFLNLDLPPVRLYD